MENSFDELTQFNNTFEIHTKAEKIMKDKQKSIDPRDVFNGKVKPIKGKSYRRSHVDKPVKTDITKKYFNW